MSQSPDDAPIEPIDDAVIEDAVVVVPTPATTPTPIAPTMPIAPAVDYTDSGVPTFDFVRDQIEGRFATSIGAAELAEDSSPAASLDEQFTAREQAGKDRLEQIRRAMRGE